MAVTDLTNTKWLMNSITCTAGYGIFDITYTCSHEGNDYECDRIWIGYRATGEGAVANANKAVTDDLAGNELWTGDTIEITGGQDVTNSSLITWLTANATQITVSDLTNTTWVLNNILDLDGTFDEYYINFTSNSENYSVFHPMDDIGQEPPVQSLFYGTPQYIDAVEVYRDGIWSEEYKTITITGGTDVTNATLIAWLEANATQQGGSASLSDTKWRFKDNPDLSSFPSVGTSYNISFVSNSNNYTTLKLATYSITYNTTEVYTRPLPLTAPSVTLSSDELTITDNDGNATGFKVYWDGSTTVAETITKTS